VAGLAAPSGVRRSCVDSAGPREVSLGELEFAAGDRVLLVGRNESQRGLVKELRGTVVATGPDGTLTLETAEQRRSRPRLTTRGSPTATR